MLSYYYLFISYSTPHFINKPTIVAKPWTSKGLISNNILSISNADWLRSFMIKSEAAGMFKYKKQC